METMFLNYAQIWKWSLSIISILLSHCIPIIFRFKDSLHMFPHRYWTKSEKMFNFPWKKYFPYFFLIQERIMSFYQANLAFANSMEPNATTNSNNTLRMKILRSSLHRILDFRLNIVAFGKPSPFIKSLYFH